MGMGNNMTERFTHDGTTGERRPMDPQELAARLADEDFWERERIAEETAETASRTERDLIRAVLVRLDAGTATTVQAQKAVAWLIRDRMRGYDTESSDSSVKGS